MPKSEIGFRGDAHRLQAEGGRHGVRGHNRRSRHAPHQSVRFASSVARHNVAETPILGQNLFIPHDSQSGLRALQTWRPW